MSGDVLARILRDGPLSWSAVGCEGRTFLEDARAEEACALIYRRQRDAPGFASWPEAVRQALEDEARAAVAKELLVQAEVMRVLEVLDRHAIHPLLFKGTALAYTHYPSPGLRSRSDTDLLIREADRGRVQDALRDVGYTSSLLCDGELLFRQFELARDDEFGVSHALDFHWAISSQPAFARVFSYDELEARALPAAALGPHARVPGRVDALILALIHPAMHHRNQRRLLWAYDVCLLAGALDGGDAQQLVTRAAEKQVAAVCAHGLRVAQDWLGTPLPPGVLERLAAVPFGEQPTTAYLAPEGSWARETAASFRALPGWRDRLRLLREIAFPSPAYVLRAYGVGRGWGRALLPALYLHRGVRGVLRVVSGNK